MGESSEKQVQNTTDQGVTLQKHHEHINTNHDKPLGGYTEQQASKLSEEKREIYSDHVNEELSHEKGEILTDQHIKIHGCREFSKEKMGEVPKNQIGVAPDMGEARNNQIGVAPDMREAPNNQIGVAPDMRDAPNNQIGVAPDMREAPNNQIGVSPDMGEAPNNQIGVAPDMKMIESNKSQSTTSLSSEMTEGTPDILDQQIEDRSNQEVDIPSNHHKKCILMNDMLESGVDVLYGELLHSGDISSNNGNSSLVKRQQVLQFLLNFYHTYNVKNIKAEQKNSESGGVGIKAEHEGCESVSSSDTESSERTKDTTQQNMEISRKLRKFARRKRYSSPWIDDESSMDEDDNYMDEDTDVEANDSEAIDDSNHGDDSKLQVREAIDDMLTNMMNGASQIDEQSGGVKDANSCNDSNHGDDSNSGSDGNHGSDGNLTIDNKSPPVSEGGTKGKVKQEMEISDDNFMADGEIKEKLVKKSGSKFASKKKKSTRKPLKNNFKSKERKKKKVAKVKKSQIHNEVVSTNKRLRSFSSGPDVEDDELKYEKITDVTSDMKPSDIYFRVKNKSPLVFMCRVCGRQYARKDHIIHHIRNHTGERPYKCLLCDKSYKHSSHLSRHALIHQDVPSKPAIRKKNFKCDLCSAAYDCRYKLTEHRALHTGEKPNKCSQCEFRTRCRENLRRHMESMHGTGPRVPYPCPECSKVYTSKASFKDHFKRVHETHIPFVCEVCGKNFKTFQGLKEHYICHGDKVYSCRYCKFKTNRPKYFKLHEANHVMKTRQCEICGKGLSSLGSLKNHLISVHGPKVEEAKSYSCRFCGATYDNKQSMNSHMRKHKNKNEEVIKQVSTGPLTNTSTTSPVNSVSICPISNTSAGPLPCTSMDHVSSTINKQTYVNETMNFPKLLEFDGSLNQPEGCLNPPNEQETSMNHPLNLQVHNPSIQDTSMKPEGTLNTSVGSGVGHMSRLLHMDKEMGSSFMGRPRLFGNQFDLGGINTGDKFDPMKLPHPMDNRPDIGEHRYPRTMYDTGDNTSAGVNAASQEFLKLGGYHPSLLTSNFQGFVKFN